MCVATGVDGREGQRLLIAPKDNRGEAQRGSGLCALRVEILRSCRSTADRVAGERLSRITKADVACAIDIVTDEESNGVHKLDLDWFMELKPQGDNNDPQVERRRVRVQVEMKLIKNRWKITSLAPLSILDPIKIQ